MMMLFQYKEEYLFITFGSKSNLVYLCPEVWSWDLCDNLVHKYFCLNANILLMVTAVYSLWMCPSYLQWNFMPQYLYSNFITSLGIILFLFPNDR